MALLLQERTTHLPLAIQNLPADTDTKVVTHLHPLQGDTVPDTVPSTVPNTVLQLVVCINNHLPKKLFMSQRNAKTEIRNWPKTVVLLHAVGVCCVVVYSTMHKDLMVVLRCYLWHG